MKLKEFAPTFFICLIVCWVATLFFLGFLLDNIYAIIFVVAFLLAVLITIFEKQETRIKDLEQKMEKLLIDKQMEER